MSKNGPVWNNIKQVDASVAAQKMYEGEENYTSDLVNSYAWDTAIVYIQKMGNGNYANANGETIGNKNLVNTGSDGDKKCNIFDLACNVQEWTTEYSTETNGIGGRTPCVLRGGYFDTRNYKTASREDENVYYYYEKLGFRPLLYLK